MTRIAKEFLFDGTETTKLYSAGYDSAKTMLGQWIQQKTGILPQDNYIGPFPNAVVRHQESNTSQTTHNPTMTHAIDVSNFYPNTHWIFVLPYPQTVTTVNNIGLYVHNTSTGTFYNKGHIQVTFTSNATITGIRAVRYQHTAGTVAVTTGGAVTGTSTLWNGGGSATAYALGSRIGFGSTNPSAITTWYTVGTIASDTSITLNGTLPVAISSGTPYVLEEIRIYLSMTQATSTLSGLYVVKGVNYDDFGHRAATSAFVMATTADNIKAIYFLQDNATQTNTAACGLAISPGATDASTVIWVTNADASTTLRVYKYEARTTLASLSSGASASAWLLKTGQYTVTGNLQSQQSCSIGNPISPAGSALFVVTSTNIYRCLESGLTSASTTYPSDSMTEVVPAANTYLSGSGTWCNIEYVPTIDKFLIGCTSASAGSKMYCTAYNSSGTALDRIFLCDNRQQSNHTSLGTTLYPSTNAYGTIASQANGIGYFTLCGSGTTLTNSIQSHNYTFAVPLGADWDYAPGTLGAFLTNNSISSNTITLTDGNQNWISGQIVTFTNSGGALPSGLAVNTFYYLAMQTASTFKVMTNLADALANTNPITLASGTGTTKVVLYSYNRLITPSIDTTASQKFYRVYTLSNLLLGDSTLGTQPEAFRVYYRQSGISDNSGSWTLVAHDGDISAGTAGSAIQFMYEFRLLGNFPIPSRIYGLVVEYEDATTDDHYEPSVVNSNAASKIFAWRLAKAWGGTVPSLSVRITDEPSSAVDWTDTTASNPNGDFEKSTNGGSSWSAYDTADKTNETTYIRYTCTASTGAATKLKARLFQT